MDFLNLLDIAITILILVMFINSIFNFSKHQNLDLDPNILIGG